MTLDINPISPKERRLSEDLGESAMWRLAERLYEKMEHLDPSDGRPWSGLSPMERDFYYFSLKAVLIEHADVCLVLQIYGPNNDVIGGGL